MCRHPSAPTGPTEEHLHDLVERSVDGDERAWAELWLALAPLVEKIAAGRRVTGRLSRCPDAQRDIVVRVMGELREDGFRRLRELGTRLQQRDGSYRRWLWRVATNSAMGYVRAHPDYLGPVEGGAGRWATVLPLSDELADARLDPIQRIEAHRILAYARDALEPAQYDALSGWLRGDDFDEIAGALQLDGADAAAAAHRLVRSAVARLRSRFAVSGSGPRKKIDRPF